MEVEVCGTSRSRDTESNVDEYGSDQLLGSEPKHIGSVYKRKRFRKVEYQKQVAEFRKPLGANTGASCDLKEQVSQPDNNKAEDFGKRSTEALFPKKGGRGPLTMEELESGVLDSFFRNRRSHPREQHRLVHICPHRQSDEDSGDSSDSDDHLVTQDLHYIEVDSADKAHCKGLLKKAGICRANFVRVSEDGGFYAFLTTDDAGKLAGLTNDGVQKVYAIRDWLHGRRFV